MVRDQNIKPADEWKGPGDYSGGPSGFPPPGCEFTYTYQVDGKPY